MSLLSTAYAAVAQARRRSCERHPERRRVLRRPVISIGNISVGGSGKTPAVAHVARVLVAAGERPAILTRGYGRQERSDGVVVVSDGERVCADLRRAGDEPLMLARALPGVAVLVGADRYLSGVLAERRFGCSVHLLDDGFQHVRLSRDLDIVLTSGDDWRGRVLPAGRLREALTALSRADAIVLTDEDGPDAGTIARETGVERVFHAARALSPLAAECSPCVALAGIARPRRFFDMLAAAGHRMVREIAFPDHHWYTERELRRVIDAARHAGARAVVTTEKDFVRLLPFRPFPFPILAAPLEFAIEPAADFGDWLGARLALARRDSPVEQPA